MGWKGALLISILVTFSKGNGDFGNDVHSQRLLVHLTDSEKLFLFGANSNTPQFEIAHIPSVKRRKRSIRNEDIDLLKKSLDLKLAPKKSFLDPQFLFLKRFANGTEPALGSHDNDEIDECYYRSHNAALYLCDDVRGVIRANETLYTIHPLPERFHSDDKKLHVIVKKPVEINDVDDTRCIESQDISNKSIEFKTWKKTRRKRDISTEEPKLDEFKLDLVHRDKTIHTFLNKLYEKPVRQRRAIAPAIFVETAVFVDKDLYKHMTINFPKDTETELIRFVLAMINAVQLLYHDPSLGRPVNFILKRLEILHEDPSNLKRPHDIDRFLSNFCTWQRLENPHGDTDPLHWDHALILTGLDLYVVSKHGKVSSQVVGLAPVAGMCTVTSSCTVNEGRHFESVFVVAHEIGHNLGMRHDGTSADNSCDPSAFIMSPTLGSGKITWSHCSKNYLEKFLDTVQSSCLLDHGNSAGQLDHSAEGILPGERFDADQQCMLKYGRGSRHSALQNLEDICRDLHCQRDRYTWTSHPALEGTKCGEDMYCTSGACTFRSQTSARWSSWGAWSECASACLVRDRRAVTVGLAAAVRRCTARHSSSSHCAGPTKKYQACHAEQCDTVPKLSIREFADQICTRAREVDADLIGTGLQRLDTEDVSSSCAVWCDTRGGGYKSRGWAFPDGTSCSEYSPKYCIAGVCQKFTCPTTEDDEFSLKAGDCEWEALNSVAPPQKFGTKQSSPWRRAAGSAWRPASGCHYHCVAPGTGLRLVRAGTRSSIQLCQPDSNRADFGCTQRKSPFQYATMVCTKYKDRVRRLSGLGMQISPVIEDPDRPCRIACQDESVSHRFYLVNGNEGWFPLGTSCGKNNTSYCVSGKCLEFGPDNTPLSEMVFTLPLLTRNATRRKSSRHKRSLLRDRMTVKATLNQEHLDAIIARLNLTENKEEHITYFDAGPEHIEVDFNNPIHIAPEDSMFGKSRSIWG